jgi:nitrite reductase/ring-hydroxylating ferredoxin subunit
MSRRLCASSDLAESSLGVRFVLDDATNGFAVRFRGGVRAFANRCPHMGTELDWQQGEFFEESGLYLVCSTHGAIFEPDSGKCVAGPCRGASLEPLQVREREGQVFLEVEPGSAIKEESISR